MTATFELEGFEPISRLGGGGFGDVWLARQTNVDRQVAIKVGHSAIQDETVRLRFDRECKALGRLSGHSNIVDVYTAGSLKDGRPYLVLEYINGGTLWQRLKKRPIPESELIPIGAQMAAALAEAHSSGVLHRDLKPENILIRSSGEAVLGDFGIARLHDGANTTSAAITASVAYAAPEILSGKRATVASDLYGIGVCLLAAVFRSVPFVQKTDESIHPIINRVLSDSPPDVRRHGVSEGLASIIDSLLSKDPAKRPSSAAELLNQFNALPRPVDPSQADANGGATQVVATPGAAVPAVPAPAGTPAGPSAQAQPRGGPGSANVAPGQYLAQEGRPIPHQSTSLNYGGNPSPSLPPPLSAIKQPSSNAKMFGLAYLATLVIGGLILYLLFQVFGGDESSAEESAETFNVESGVDNAVEQESEADVTDDEEAGNEGGLLQEGSELVLPLDVADTSFDADADVSDDSFGPGAGTLCDNEPPTAGLVEWKGQAITTDQGLRSLYQIVSRFESPEQAADYLDAYAETNNCESWIVPTDQGADVTYIAQQTAPPAYGDRSRRFEIQGELEGTTGFTIYARVLLVQSGTDVLSLNLSAVSETQVAELDDLGPLAAERLGFSS